VEHIHKNIKPTKLTPQQFYKGYYKDFSPIIHEYDIRRTITDNLISEIFLLNEEERKSSEELYIIRGHAGSGKTILLQRIAWDVAITFDKLCLWLHSGLFPEYEALVELHRLCGERIFLFADPIHKYLEVVELWLTKARSDKLPLTIISTERNHEWNVACKDLYPYVDEIYDLKYLNAQEIERLIEILAENKSLGYLEGLSLDQQKEAFTKRAGKQLLVALYESTLGKPFEEIVYDEFKSIAPIQAQSLYLTICILHRLGIPCRAGLISRAHGISFLEFEARFFKPLEFIVFAYEDKRLRDYVYHSRHPVVAEMAFERVLTDEQERFNEYKRILDSVDTGFSSDREAFIRLTNARELLALFRNPELIRNLYKAGYSRVGEDVALLQQEGIFEMNSPDGSIEKSGELLRKAIAKKPDSRMVRHSLAEWALKKSEKATTDLEKVKYRRESKSIARELTQQELVDSYPHHTLIKIGLDELTEIIISGDETTIERKVGEIERIIASAKQAFPDDSFILSEESRFCKLINKHPQARISLEKAFANNKGRTYIAVRLAHIYEGNNEPEKAITVISECVDERPSDKYANYTLALLQQKYHPEKKADIKIHLRRSFTDGDSNYAAQYWFARFLYLEDPSGEATKYFKMLGQARLAPEVKDKCRGIVAENDIPVIFHGVVHKKEHSFGFIMRDGYQDMIFMHRNDMSEALWDELKEGNRINFQLGFSYRGSRARTVIKEAK
ncbi:cold shock domain-containing protein, partial [Candidatus Pacearchaeota archaeon]|nr:cold shock domain-containing protein [Candidatus Pacearchaeota archaeon]